MDASNLFNAYEELFQLRDYPSELFGNAQIIPFYKYKGNDRIPINEDGPSPVVIIDKDKVSNSAEPVNGNPPGLFINGKILGFYLPFHFYYDHDSNESDQFWGVYILEEGIAQFADFLEELGCKNEQKVNIATIYIFNFTCFYHKLEIFVANNEIFERTPLYKTYFKSVDSIIMSEIDKYAHSYALKKILEKNNLNRTIDSKDLKNAQTMLGKIFRCQPGLYGEVEVLLNSIYRYTHPDAQKRDDRIWKDLKHIFNSHLRIDILTNIFILKPENQ